MSIERAALDTLVSTIAGRLGPGFAVAHRRPVFAEGGSRLVTCEITLTGRLGPAPITWLIACRDRPDPAPRAWIEELLARRGEPQTMLAVSTTGFRDDARALANGEHVLLRTVPALAELATTLTRQTLDAFIATVTATSVLAGLPMDSASAGITGLAWERIRIKAWRAAAYDSVADFVLAHLPSTVARDAVGRHQFTFRYDAPVDLTDGRSFVRWRDLRLEATVDIERHDTPGLLARVDADAGQGGAEEGDIAVPPALGGGTWAICLMREPRGARVVVRAGHGASSRPDRPAPDPRVYLRVRPAGAQPGV